MHNKSKIVKIFWTIGVIIVGLSMVLYLMYPLFYWKIPPSLFLSFGRVIFVARNSFCFLRTKIKKTLGCEPRFWCSQNSIARVFGMRTDFVSAVDPSGHHDPVFGWGLFVGPVGFYAPAYGVWVTSISWCPPQTQKQRGIAGELLTDELPLV